MSILQVINRFRRLSPPRDLYVSQNGCAYAVTQDGDVYMTQERIPEHNRWIFCLKHCTPAAALRLFAGKPIEMHTTVSIGKLRVRAQRTPLGISLACQFISKAA